MPGSKQLTNINHIATSTGVEMKRRITCWAILRVELADVLVETSFMRNMCARELQDALASESVLQWLLTNGAFAADKCSLPPCAGPLGCARHDVVVYSAPDTSRRSACARSDRTYGGAGSLHGAPECTGRDRAACVPRQRVETCDNMVSSCTITYSFPEMTVPPRRRQEVRLIAIRRVQIVERLD